MNDQKLMRERVNHLSDQVSTLTLQNQELHTKIGALHTQMMQVFTFLGDTETRLEAFKTMGVRHDLFTESEYEATWDEIKGLRVRGDNEPIEAGDFLRVSYDVFDADGSPLASDKNFPMRVGSGKLLIEDKLISKTAAELQGYEFAQTYPENYEPNRELSGKTVTFRVTVGKVKTKIQEATAHA